MYFQDKKSLKIPKGQSETVYLRRTDNTMAKRKKVQNDKHIHKDSKEVFVLQRRVTFQARYPVQIMVNLSV